MSKANSQLDLKTAPSIWLFGSSSLSDIPLENGQNSQFEKSKQHLGGARVSAIFVLEMQMQTHWHLFEPWWVVKG